MQVSSSTVTASIATKLPLAGGTMTGDLILGDNVKLEVGSASGGDLQIYHDGSNSFIQDAGTGQIRILGDDVRIYNAAGTKIGAQFIQDGEARLKHNNITMLATKDYGVDILTTGALKIPVGTTAQRPSAATGQLRWNTSDGALEVYNGSAWTAVGTGSSNKILDTFTGDGSTTAYTLSVTPANEDALIVFIDGVYQEKGDYALSNAVLTLDTAPASGEKLAVHITTASVHDGTSGLNQQFTGDGSTVAFTLSQDPKSENNTQIYINGVYQQKTDYTVSGTTLTFDTAPETGDIIEVNMFTVTTLGNTDTVSEGTSNLYHTTARARGAISVSGNALSYNSSTGVITSAYEESPTFTGDVVFNSTGSIKISAGTTAQRPSSPSAGATRFNTTLDEMEIYDGTNWRSLKYTGPVITGISGNINNAYSTTLSITGVRFGTQQGSVRFTPNGGSTTSVNVTPTNDTTISIAVPSAIYGQSAGTSITIEFTSSSGNASTDGQTKTVIAAPTGGTITTSGTARIHKFTSSGTFVNSAEITSVRYLIVGGGGGGGTLGGGGGAGGMLSGTSMSVSNTSYSVVIGAGANGGAPGTAGSIGGNTAFNSLTALGGGGGGSHNSGSTSVAGTNGGSGGGGSDNSTSYPPGSGTSGQGNAGGPGSLSFGATNRGGGGGGGKGAVGDDIVNGAPDGGVGAADDILGTSYYWAGGGGGSPYASGSLDAGDGGNGGGGGGAAGAGGNSGSQGTGGSGLNSGANGTTTGGGIAGANTGGGGGGNPWSQNKTSTKMGGDGIVVIRYEM